MQKILVSACLLGNQVRYDGTDLFLDSGILIRWQIEGRIVDICPEVSGGLPIPRPPAEIVGGDGDSVLSGRAAVTAVNGNDVTDNFLEGAQRALNVCREHKIKVAILTESSPSCGSSRIHDGSFSDMKIPGVGVTTALLRKHGILVFSHHEVNDASEYLDEVTD